MTDKEHSEEEELHEGGKVMSLWEHLDELRGRLVRSMIAILIIFCIAMIFWKELMLFLAYPLMDVLPEGSRKLNITEIHDVLMTSIKVAFLASLMGAAPIWTWQFWKFLEPALYPKERKYIIPFTVASVLLFFAGTTFCFLVILPMALEFLISMGTEIANPIITVKSYISMITLMIFGFGLMFETPLVLILCSLMGLIEWQTLAKYRRMVMVAILVAAAMLTPPDPMSQIGLAVPLYLMYEISIIIIRLLKRNEAPQ